MLLQDAVAEAPGGAVGFEEVAGGHFIQEIHEAQGQHPGTVELPAEQPVLEDGEVEGTKSSALPTLRVSTGVNDCYNQNHVAMQFINDKEWKPDWQCLAPLLSKPSEKRQGLKG